MRLDKSTTPSCENKLDHAGFKQLFEKHYRALTVFALDYVHDHNTAKDIVQNVFLRLWESRERYVIKKSSKAYLYQSVKNACINHKQSKHSRMVFTDDIPMQVMEDDVLARMIAIEKLDAVLQAIESLPPQCRDIFKLSRIKQLRHAEIAEKLHISEKTVENQIGIALKKLSGYLKVFYKNPASLQPTRGA